MMADVRHGETATDLCTGVLVRRSGQRSRTSETGNCPRVRSRPPRFLKHLGPKALAWLADLFTRMVWEHRITKIGKQAKIIALAKPGKNPHLATSYRPIGLLNVCYKLLEHTILQRICPTVEALLSVDQQYLRPGHSLTTFIENRFEKTL